jgi:hypothetical protein
MPRAYIIDLAADDVLLNNCVSLQCNAFTNSPFKTWEWFMEMQ